MNTKPDFGQTPYFSLSSRISVLLEFVILMWWGNLT